MRRKVITSVVLLLLALSAGVAYAAAQLSSGVVTQVCVNDTNGLMRASSECRVGEHLVTLGGGGGSVQVTQNGTFTVAWGTTAAGTTLPLTGVEVAGKCRSSTYGETEYGIAHLLITTSGTMDAFTTGPYPDPSGTIGGTSLVTNPGAAAGSGVIYGVGPPTIVTSNGATATITFGAQVDAAAKTCKYLWQAVEAPN